MVWPRELPTLNLVADRVDVIGDVHGCYEHLMGLLSKLGYEPNGFHPDGRQLILVGDLFDRGPDNAKVYRWVRSSHALMVTGNHEWELADAIRNGGVDPDLYLPDLKKTMAQLTGAGIGLQDVLQWIEKLPERVVVNEELVILHGSYLRLGDEHAEKETVVGHIIGHDCLPMKHGNVYYVDTGCFASGKLTALRWPEREFVTFQGDRNANGNENPGYP